MSIMGISTLRDRWLSIAAHRLAQVGCEPARLVYAALGRCTEQERERLVEAATMFLELGSLVDTAASLPCHRNTVVNRLASFQKYIGLNLQKPRDSADALMALWGKDVAAGFG
jgi:sugar diacid utilization regulator